MVREAEHLAALVDDHLDWHITKGRTEVAPAKRGGGGGETKMKLLTLMAEPSFRGMTVEGEIFKESFFY